MAKPSVGHHRPLVWLALRPGILPFKYFSVPIGFSRKNEKVVGSEKTPENTGPKFRRALCWKSL